MSEDLNSEVLSRQEQFVLKGLIELMEQQDQYGQVVIDVRTIASKAGQAPKGIKYHLQHLVAKRFIKILSEEGYRFEIQILRYPSWSTG